MTITDHDFWEKYWLDKGNSVFQKINENYLFGDVFKDHLPSGDLSCLEIGGFPGYFSIFFAKYFGFNPTLLDFYINKEVLDKLCLLNDVKNINVIESDLFNYEPEERFDVVMSFGFIEHFDNPDDVMKHHLKFLKNGGYLIIELPNFNSTNGLIQWLFDRQNLKAHNLEIMSLKFMEGLFNRQGLELLYGQYYGKFGVWLERLEERPQIVQKTITYLNYLGSRFLPLKSTRIFSPFILYIGRFSEE